MRSKFRKWINTVLAVLLLVGMLPFRGTQTVAENTASPKISVIIPVYNVEPYLRQCLDSVVNQTLKDIEIICIDDCSTDNSLEILKEYAQKDGRIVLIHMEVNQGAYVARNKGLEVASGEYIGFVDPDDYIELNTYEVSYNTARQNDADIVVFGGKSFGKVEAWADKELTTPDCTYRKDFIKALLYTKGARLHVWNKIYKKSLLDSNKVTFVEGRTGFDMVFNFKVFPLAKTIIFISDKFCHWRKGVDSSISATKWEDLNFRYQQEINLFSLICKDWRNSNYIKGNELALLEYVTRKFGHYSKIKHKDKSWFCKQIIDILGPGVFNEENIAKLSPNVQCCLKNLRHCANRYSL